MSDNHNYKFKKVKDFSGETLVLTLVKKEEYKDKLYDLYTVCKVVQDGDEKIKIPLYDETFTREQVESFYNDSTYYTPGDPEEE